MITKTEMLTLMDSHKAKRPLRSPRSIQLEHNALLALDTVLRLDTLFALEAFVGLHRDLTIRLGLLSPLDFLLATLPKKL